MKVPNDKVARPAAKISLSRLQNEGSQHKPVINNRLHKSIKVTE
ncbi:hypothetical protein HMPREF0742_02687 [Rothia aeria F0184]|uniref:Uncharacterized protein n=1 Tax=Rothia aeria F0184 TaxID=888019 RepID=U7UWC1_9MICC|nr:hypothetical protein HMPREF0742_02687 [Rothia aeria F0184]